MHGAAHAQPITNAKNEEQLSNDGYEAVNEVKVACQSCSRACMELNASCPS